MYPRFNMHPDPEGEITMSKFKVGDRVLSIRSGAIGLVKETSPHVTSVDVSGGIVWFSTDDLVTAPIVSVGTNYTLTRRDRFAMAALSGLLANGLIKNLDGPDEVSAFSYELADAMEIARNKEGGE